MCTHMTKLVDMYCRDHDEVGCTSCMAEKHRSCKAVVTVSDVINKSGPPNPDDTLPKQLTSLIEVCKRIQCDKEQDILDADKDKQKAIDEIMKQRKDLNKVLNQLELASRQDEEKKHTKFYAKSKEVKQRVKEYELKLQKRMTSLRSSKGNAAQQFVSGKIGQKDFNTITDATNEIKQAEKKRFEFTGDFSIYQALTQHKSLGKVTLHTTGVSNPERKKTLYKMKRTNTLNVKLMEDKKECYIRDCCFFDSNNILLADSDNDSVKRVNLQTQSVIDHCDMPDSPKAVCSVNTSEAAVTLYNKTIQFVSFHGHMTITRQVKLDHNCFGIACVGGKVYVTGELKKLYIYDLSGTLAKTVEKDTLENNVFANNRHVTYNSYNDNVYVVDINKGLVCFDKNGKYKWNLRNEIFGTPIGGCADGKGNIFMCSWGSKNVVQIGSNGMLFGKVVSASSGLGPAWSVCFDNINNRLVVKTSKHNEILIFDLE